MNAWNDGGWSNIKFHFFGHSYYEHPPLDDIFFLRKIMPRSLAKEIDDFHSEVGMSRALEKFKLGEQINLKDAKPGDIITFDRTNGSGHSAVFLNFVDNHLNPTTKYDPKKVVGFRYFSSQSSHGSTAPGHGGLFEKIAYFSGFCPYEEGRPSNSNVKESESTSENERRFPPQSSATRARLLCVYRDNQSQPRVGRIWSPELWKFRQAQELLKEQESC